MDGLHGYRWMFHLIGILSLLADYTMAFKCGIWIQGNCDTNLIPGELVECDSHQMEKGWLSSGSHRMRRTITLESTARVMESSFRRFRRTNIPTASHSLRME